MRLRAFQINEPHALAVLRPWVDVGNEGTMTLSRLESYYGAAELAKLGRPVNFFDFTRHRPVACLKEGRRDIQVGGKTIRRKRWRKNSGV